MKRPRSFLAGAFAVVAVLSLYCLNAAETTTVSQPYYAPLFGVKPHPPPYVMKEMGVTVCVDRGWPLWFRRETVYGSANNAALFIEGYGTPNAKLVEEGMFSARDAAQMEIRATGAIVDGSVALAVIALAALAPYMLGRRRRNRPILSADATLPASHL